MNAVRSYVLEPLPVESPVAYSRHEPEKTLLYQTVQNHFLTFVAECEASNHPVPYFVKKEFEAFLKCGILAHGFARVYCQECRFDRLVAFSCKRRAFCPSCMARRMSETAAHLVDSVIPYIPTRQWVLSLPTPLRYLMAYDSKACNFVLSAFTSAISSFLALKAKKQFSLSSAAQAHAGSVTFIQRFGSAMNLNVHFHTLSTDGVFVEDDAGKIQFQQLPAPTQAEIMQVTERIACKVQRWLKKRLEDCSGDELSEKEPLLSACYAASIKYYSAIGERAGRPLMRVLCEPVRGYESSREERSVAGFNLHASTAIGAEDRVGLEQLLRYMGRPPISESRLSQAADGRIILKFKKAWSDGTAAIIMQPQEFLERLTSLVPPPRKNQIRYHGIFASNSKWREQIVPKQIQEVCDEAASTDGKKCPGSGMRWAKLLARVWGVDVLSCPRCESQMQLISFISERKAIVDILESLQMATAPPEVARACRTARQDEFDFA
jgi:hypothetical protein